MIDKQTVFEFLLMNTHVVAVMVNRRAEGVKLPKDVKSNKLNYSLNMLVPKQNVVSNTEGIRALMSFNGVVHDTFIPWRAVTGMGVDDEVTNNQFMRCGFVWNAGEPMKPAKKVEEKEPPKRPGHLRSV